MGSLFSKLRRKRKLEVDADDSSSPKSKRVKLNSTVGCSTQIGYSILFQQGRDSDIEVVLLNKTWKLHKSFIQQSPYFMKLLGENSKVNKLSCSVSDSNVDNKSLELCFGFLYGSPLDFIRQENVHHILATATLLEMTDIIERVALFLTKHSNIENAIKYYYLADRYGLQDVCHHNYQRLLLHLMLKFKQILQATPEQMNTFLKDIKLDLLLKLLKDPDLVVVTDEYDVYLLMKKWTAVAMGSVDSEVFNTENIVIGQSFLESPLGGQFSPLFEILSLPNVFTTSRYYELLKQDRILPAAWLERGLDASWKTHVTYYDATQSTDVDRHITPLQRVRIIRREKCFIGIAGEDPAPYRLFKRFTAVLNKADVSHTTLNGFVFSLCITGDNTLELNVRVKPDVPHILIPTLLYLRYTIFDLNSVWNEGTVPACASLPPSTDTGAFPSATASQTEDEPSGSGTYDFQWRSGVFTGSDLMFLLPYPPSGLSRVLYDLPSGYYERIRSRPNGDRKQSADVGHCSDGHDLPGLHAFVTIKMVPYFEAAKLL